MLVTGCAGFIGSHTVDELLARGHDVRGVDAFTGYYDRGEKTDHLRDAVGHARFDLVEADLRVADVYELLDGVDIVIHLAGQPGVRASWADGFADYVGHNVLATQRVLEAARACPVQRVVYASSSSVYGNAPTYPTTELDLPRPHSPYGVTKLGGEHLACLYAENWALPTVSLRYFTVYGPRQRPDMGFRRFLAAAMSGAPIPVYGSGEQIRDFTYVDDVVQATVSAAFTDVAPGTVLNVAGGESTTVNDLVALMGRLLGRTLPTDRLPPQPGDVQRTGGSITAARSILGWEPVTRLPDGLTAEIAWVLDRSRRLDAGVDGHGAVGSPARRG